jgi:Small-conductance mechanosensitive channel
MIINDLYSKFFGFINEFLPQIIISVITIVAFMIVRAIIAKIIRKYSALNSKLEVRTNHIVRVCSIFIKTICVIMLIIIWGVNTHNLFIALSSIFAVIGVALFAQWSILSNLTAGLVIFFSSPIKIGDFICIQDKDFPIEAYITDIQTLYTHLETKDSTKYIIPNNILLQKAIAIVGGQNKNDSDH